MAVPRNMADSLSESEQSLEPFKIISEPVIDAGRASGEPFTPQHLVFDFTPEPADEEVTPKCRQFWETVNNDPALDGMMVLPECSREATLRNVTASVPVHQSPHLPKQEADYPALQTIVKIAEAGTIEAALQTSHNNKAYC